MKDFCEWLGVNEKVAKLVVWIFIGMVFLIVTNAMLESIGLPFYKLTIENLSNMDTNIVLEYLLNWFVVVLNFYSVIFLVFRIKDFKKIFPYSILYLLVNIFVYNLFGDIFLQIVLFLFVVLFCYFYSKRNWKYIFYGFISYLIGVFVQFICYLYKVRFIDFTKVNSLNLFLISIDFFLVMGVIIFVKEIIVKKKGSVK